MLSCEADSAGCGGGEMSDGRRNLWSDEDLLRVWWTVCEPRYHSRLPSALLAAVKASIEFEGSEEAYTGTRGEEFRFISGSGLRRESVLGVLEPLVLESSREGGERRMAV